MATSIRLGRQKISTTISPTTLAHLERSIERGEARNLAEAIDLSVQELLAYRNRERLSAATSEYFEQLSTKAAEEEAQLAAALAKSAKGIDVDLEP
jgi:Arc/MetJ-type ribon-helix-helix transcriptional regulator